VNAKVRRPAKIINYFKAFGRKAQKFKDITSHLFFYVLVFSKAHCFTLKTNNNEQKIFTLIALSAAINALAQKDTLRSTNLDEVTVTATKFPIKTSATGKVVTIITQQQLEQSGERIYRKF